VVAVQAFAKWLYPETFSSLDPHATMAELFERFQPVPLNGTYWVSLSVASDGVASDKEQHAQHALVEAVQ
jgi:hypothetical protein